jgi:hypothetical protein
MLGAPTAATKTIITNGLAVRPATDRMLSAWKFHLYVETDITPEIPKIVKGGGGPYPGAAWNKIDDIKKFFKPVDDQLTPEGEDPYIVPLDKEGKYLERKVNIVLRAKFGENEIERIYAINEKYSPMAVTITNFVNVTSDRMKVVVENIRKVANRAFVKIKNIVLK